MIIQRCQKNKVVTELCYNSKIIEKLDLITLFEKHWKWGVKEETKDKSNRETISRIYWYTNELIKVNVYWGL